MLWRERAREGDRQGWRERERGEREGAGREGVSDREREREREDRHDSLIIPLFVIHCFVHNVLLEHRMRYVSNVYDYN